MAAERKADRNKPGGGLWRTVNREMKHRALTWGPYNDEQLTEISDGLAKALCAPMHYED